MKRNILTLMVFASLASCGGDKIKFGKKINSIAGLNEAKLAEDKQTEPKVNYEWQSRYEMLNKKSTSILLRPMGGFEEISDRERNITISGDRDAIILDKNSSVIQAVSQTDGSIMIIAEILDKETIHGERVDKTEQLKFVMSNTGKNVNPDSSTISINVRDIPAGSKFIISDIQDQIRVELNGKHCTSVDLEVEVYELVMDGDKLVSLALDMMPLCSGGQNGAELASYSLNMDGMNTLIRYNTKVSTKLAK